MSQTGLIFNPATGLYAPETADIRENIAADWTQAFADPDGPLLDTEPTTPAGQLIDSETALIEGKNAQILYLANQFNPLVADGVWQDALGYIYFLDRQFETPSVVTAQLTGLAGTVIPAGSLVRTVDGITLIATSAATIGTDGTAQAIFSTQDAGPIQILAHSVNTVVTTIPGWDTVDNPTAAVPGRYRESRSEFEQRRFASVAKNAHGSVAALYSEIANLEGVLDLAVFDNDSNVPVVKWGVTLPPHSVYMSVYGGDDTAIASAIYHKKDAGCSTSGNTIVSYTDEALGAYPGGIVFSYNIERPAPLALAVQVTFRPTPSTPATVEKDIKAAVLADFNGQGENGRVRMASTVYASRFYCPVISAGVQDLVGIKLAAPLGSGWSDEVTVRADQIPVLSTDDISINTVSVS